MMNINNIWFWILILINILGFFIYKFSSIANGAKKEFDKAIGLTMVGISYIFMLLNFGWISFLILLFAVPLLVTPFLMIIINRLEDRFFPERIKLRKSYGTIREQYNSINKNSQKKINDFIKKHGRQ